MREMSLLDLGNIDVLILLILGLERSRVASNRALQQLSWGLTVRVVRRRGLGFRAELLGLSIVLGAGSFTLSSDVLVLCFNGEAVGKIGSMNQVHSGAIDLGSIEKFNVIGDCDVELSEMIGSSCVRSDTDIPEPLVGGGAADESLKLVGTFHCFDTRDYGSFHSLLDTSGSLCSSVTHSGVGLSVGIAL